MGFGRGSAVKVVAPCASREKTGRGRDHFRETIVSALPELLTATTAALAMQVVSGTVAAITNYYFAPAKTTVPTNTTKTTTAVSISSFLDNVSFAER